MQYDGGVKTVVRGMTFGLNVALEGAYEWYDVDDDDIVALEP